MPLSEMQVANARLIAAAPELYEVLEEYLHARPASRVKPVGSPGSAARLEQEAAIAAEDRAKAILRKIRGDESPLS